MMPGRIYLIALSFLFANSVSAEFALIETTNGLFKTPKEAILHGPDGFLKAAYSNQGQLQKSLAEDGSLFVNVDAESMRYALSYIRHQKLDRSKIRSSSVLMNDFQFLFPGLVKKKSRNAKMIWECAAYCDFDRPKPVKFMSTTHFSLTTAWQNLIGLCTQEGNNAYLVSQVIHFRTDYLQSLSAMGNSCVQVPFKQSVTKAIKNGD